MKRISLIYIVFLISLSSCFNSGQTGIVSSNLKYAKELRIQKEDNYSVVEVRDSWDTLKLRQRYILIPKELEIPEHIPEGTIIRVPVERAAIYASTHVSIIEELGKLDAVKAVCESEYLSSETVKNLVKTGSIVDLGLSSSPSIEKLIDSRCEIIIASPFENGGYGAVEKLKIPIVEAADYMENQPLGRTEWVKFYGLLFGCEDLANSIFHTTEKRYYNLKSLVDSVSDRPTLLVEKKYGSAWGIANADSYIATIHKDAGAHYLFMDYDGTGSTQLSFETVYERAHDADIWLIKYASEQDMTYSDLKSEYLPYSNFSAFINNKIYGCNTLKNSYFDDITLHPDWILEDLIHIYHPELLDDDYLPRYYQIFR